jgi:hypothetical protein
MKSRAVIAALPVPKEEIFSYFLVIGNLPKWAAHFARALKVVNDRRHKVINELSVFSEKRADESTGRDRHALQPGAGSEGCLPTGPVGSPGCTSSHTFTASHDLGMCDEYFDT